MIINYVIIIVPTFVAVIINSSSSVGLAALEDAGQFVLVRGIMILLIIVEAVCALIVGIVALAKGNKNKVLLGFAET